MDCSQATRDKTPVKEEVDEPNDEASSSYSRVEETPVQSEEDEEDEFETQTWRLRNLIHLYS